jgi:NAD(P)-dependent dehydrogenase (short-subunit alcohol dehydrogenase family)
LTEQVAAEVKQQGISTFAIEPGTVYTEMAESTINDPDAQRWVPGMLEVLKQVREKEDPAKGFARCAAMCIRLASGRYDGLSGRYLTPEDDFDALLAQKR